MNFLALANKMCRAIGYAEMSSIALAGPDQLLVLEWVADAWVHIQSMETRWSFMKFSAEVNLLSAKNEYTIVEMGIPTMKEIVVGKTALLNSDDTFNTYLTWLTLDEMEERILRFPNTAVPEYYSDEDGVLTIYPTPDEAYKLKFKYMGQPIVLTDGTDIPANPEHLHKIINFKALHEYSVSDNSPEQFQFGSAEFEQYLNRMQRECLPQVKMSGRKTGSFYEQKHSNRYTTNGEFL